jgi:hypothetical protein
VVDVPAKAVGEKSVIERGSGNDNLKKHLLSQRKSPVIGNDAICFNTEEHQ